MFSYQNTSANEIERSIGNPNRLLYKSLKIKIMKKYAMIQIDADLHASLKVFCREKGYKIGGLIENLIKDRIESSKKPLPKTTLSTKI